MDAVTRFDSGDCSIIAPNRTVRIMEDNMNEWNDICNHIRQLPCCPDDADFKLVIEMDGRMWIDVLSDNLCSETLEPELNTCEPVWNSFVILDPKRL